jgi:hypothetical protein
MKKRFLWLMLPLAALAVAMIPPLSAQPLNPLARTVNNALSDPAVCNPTAINIFLNRATPAFKVCTAANTWTAVVMSGGSGGWPLLAPNGSGAAPSYSYLNFPALGEYAESGFLDTTMGEGAWRVMAQTTAPTALTTALVTSAGNIDAGSHSYKVTFVTAGGETEGGTASNSVVNDGTHAQNSLSSVPTSAFTAATQRKIYRNKVADQTHWFLQQTIADNTTTTGVQDNTADSGLGAAMPLTNGALDARLTVNNAGQAIVNLGSAATPSVTFTGLLTTGMYSVGATQISLAFSGIEGVRFNSTGVSVLSDSGLFRLGAAADTILSRRAAAGWNIGGADLNGTPINQKVTSQGAITGTNLPGGNLEVAGGPGTGNAAGQQIAIDRYLMTGTGTTQQTTQHAAVVCESKTLSNTSATTTALATIAAPSNSAGGFHAFITVVATDGTNFDAETQDVTDSWVNKAGVFTVGTALITTSTAASNSGSTTIGATITGAASLININVTPVFTTIVPTTVTAYLEVNNHSAGAVTCK